MLKNSSTLLQAEGLRKFYGTRLALKDLSFSLAAGRVLGFLGPNGAGKTTAIRILTTMLEPDSGHFMVDGISSEYPEKIRGRIGVVPENLGFPKQITAIEYLTYFGQLYGRSSRDARSYGQILLEDVGLKQRAKSLVGTFSRGMRQRLGIARALVNNPLVVFLDEPTLGLDPRGQQELLSLTRRIAVEREAGVILCSHALSEIEEICDDVVILMSGQVIASGPVAEVVAQTQQNTVRIHIPPGLVAKARQILETQPNVKSVASEGKVAGWLAVQSADAGISSEKIRNNNNILEALVRAEIPILSFQAESGLQEVFLQLTEEALK